MIKQIALITGMVCIVCSCTTTYQPRSHFPLTVLKGTANMLISIRSHKTAREQAETLKHAANAYGPGKKRNTRDYTPLLKPSPSENDYISSVYLPEPQEMNTLPQYHYEMWIQTISEGGQLSLTIPDGCLIEVTITNNQPEILQYTCDGNITELKTHEKQVLIFK